MLSVLVGLAAVAVLPAAVAAAELLEVATLLESAVAIAPAAVLSIAAILLARRARRHVERTLGRAGGASLARAGQILGWIGLYLAATATISVTTYYLLREFAS